MPLINSVINTDIFNTGFRGLKRVIPVDITKKIDGYASRAILNLQTAVGKRGFTDLSKRPATAASVAAEPGTPANILLDFDSTIRKDIKSIVADMRNNTLPLNGYSLEEKVDKDAKAGLFLQVQEKIVGQFLSFNTDALLALEEVRYFLFVFAVYNLKLTDSNAIVKFMTDEKDGGVKALYDAVVVEGMQNLIFDERINVPPAALADLENAAQAANISFAEGTFSNSLKKLIEKFVFAGDELVIINTLNTDQGLQLTEAETALLIDFIKKSKLKVNASNAQILLLPELLKIRNTGIENFPSGTTVGDSDFAVDYFQEDSAALEINRDNVLCAAQLYFVMTIGDEMDVFNVIHRIATRYLTTGMVDIRSRSLLEDLQLYVFSDRFRDLRTGAQHERTRMEERAMFYMQVFGGDHKTKLGEGMVSNAEFAPLWETLMYETAKYLHKLEKSENPQFFVSRQNIAQAIEDLQYNLSTYCTGMVKVLAPLANRELDFVMKRFLQNEEILRQLAPRSSTSVWKVIERILQEWKGRSVNVVALRNKAIYGHMILQAVGGYEPSLIDNDAKFSEFISTVEAYIIANSQLEGHGERRALPAGDDGDMDDFGPSHNGQSNGKGSDDWDF